MMLLFTKVFFEVSSFIYFFLLSILIVILLCVFVPIISSLFLFYLSFFLNLIGLLVFTVSFYYFFIVVDNISLLFIWLTVLIFLLCILYLPSNMFYYPYWLAVILFTEVLILIAFAVENFFIFFMVFEMLLMPMFFVIILWGSRGRRLHAVMFFFYYTFSSSIPLFCGLFLIYYYCGTFSMSLFSTFNLDIVLQLFLLILFFLGFAAKVPTCPFHIWLPEAHVESPTVGSVVLASLLLKLGAYGLLRVIVLCPDALFYLRIFVWVICIYSIYVGVLCACRMIDIKKLVAYSSIVHMNFCLMAIFSVSNLSTIAVIFSMLSHAFTSAALFFAIGMLYDRIHTRNILYIAGHELVALRWFRWLIWFHLMANMGIPFSANFIAELYVYLTLINENFIVFFISAIGIFLFSCLYNLFLLYRLLYGRSEFFGSLIFSVRGFKQFNDLNVFEITILIVLMLFTLCFGIFTPITQNFLFFNYTICI